MRNLTLLFCIYTIYLAACGKTKTDPIIAELEKPRECQEQPGAQQVIFPDGTSRKTAVLYCEDGCTLFVEIGSPATSLRLCDK